MAAICYRVQSEEFFRRLLPLPGTIIHAKFREDISSYKGLIRIVQFVWQLNAVVVRYRRFSKIAISCGEKDVSNNFQINISEIEGLVRVYTSRDLAIIN